LENVKYNLWLVTHIGRVLSIEKEEHYYNPDHKHLLDLGYRPAHDMDAELEIMFKDLIRYRERIKARQYALIPDIRWDGTRRKIVYKNRSDYSDRQ
jgi:hypothetical protein